MNSYVNWIKLLFSFFLCSQLYAKEIKQLAVFEPIDTSDPWTSTHMKRDYTSAAEIALAHFKDTSPSFIPEIRYFFLDDTPLDQVHDAILKSQSLAMTGNVFIYQSLASSHFSRDNGITYINPMCSGDFLFTNGFSKSLGTPAEREIKAVQGFIDNNIKYSDIFILYRNNVGYDLYYKHRFKKLYPKAKLVGGLQHSDIDISKIVSSKRPLVIVASQAHNMVNTINKIQKHNKEVIFFGTNQWGHVDDFFRPTLKDKQNINMYAASDYMHVSQENIANLKSIFDLNISLKKAKKFRDDFKKRYQREPAAFGHLVYDSVMLSFMIMDNEHVKTRDSFLSALNNIEKYEGVTSNFIAIGGNISKAGYLLKWKENGFVPIEEF